MSAEPHEDARAFWESFAKSRSASDVASVASLATYSTCPDYDAYRDHAELAAVQSLLPELPQHWRVLDIGCGPGRWTARLAQRCSAVTAIDFSDEMLNHARLYCRQSGVEQKVTFQQSRVEEVEVNTLNGPFDLVLCMGVLQYVSPANLQNAAERIARCVKPGGYLLHRESRARVEHVRQLQNESANTMRSFYRRSDSYPALFAPHGFSSLGRRSILPPSLPLSLLLRRFRSGHPGVFSRLMMRVFIASHNTLFDPAWRVFPELLWRANSRRSMDQTAVLYRKESLR